MVQCDYSREIVITPGTLGLRFWISSTDPLRLPGQIGGGSPWRRRIFSIVLAVIILAVPRFSLAATFTAADIAADTNAVRSTYGLPALNINAKLERAAQAKAADMFAQQYFDHYSPTGQSPWNFFSNNGYLFTKAGENLAINFTAEASILPTWMSSVDHRANILNPAYHDLGIAVMDGVMDGTATTIIVQFFGSQNSVVATSPPTVTKKKIPAKAQAAPETRTKPTISKPEPIVNVSPPAVSDIPNPIPPELMTSQVSPVPNVLGVTDHPTSPIQVREASIELTTVIGTLVMYAFGYYLVLLSGIVYLSRVKRDKVQQILAAE